MLIILFLVIILAVFWSSDYNYDLFTYITAILAATAGIIHIFPLTAAVLNDAKRKSLGSRIVWSVLTFLFGLPIAVLYALFTFKVGKYSNRKENKKTIVNSVASLILLAIFLFGAYGVIKYMQHYENTHFPAYIETYKNDSDEDIIYDKMGNSYTIEESKDFKYYDRIGNAYTAATYTLLFSGEVDYMQCIETKKKYDKIDCNFYIDKDGYLIIEEYNDEIIYDNSYDTYNSLNCCSWTPDGKLIVKDKNY